MALFHILVYVSLLVIFGVLVGCFGSLAYTSRFSGAVDLGIVLVVAIPINLSLIAQAYGRALLAV